MNELDSKLEKLKKYSYNKEMKRLTKKIYDLDLSDSYLKSLSQSLLQYVHVRLHNALYYKKPFAPIDNIKKVHDIVAKLLKNHQKIDELDK